MKIDEKSLSDSLDMDPIELDAAGIKPINPPKRVDSTEDDFDFARGNLLNIIMKGGEAVDEMLEFSRASQHPRSYEVLSTLLKTLTDANKDLLSLQKTRKELMKDESNPQTVNQNLFVGSTAELQKLLSDKKE